MNEQNRLIFANSFNDFTGLPSSEERAASGELSAAQEIWLAKSGDILVTPRPLAPDFKDFALRAMGLPEDELLMLSPHAAPAESLTDAVRRVGVMQILKRETRKRPEIRIRACGLDRPLLALAQELETGIEGYGASGSTITDDLYRLNTKTGFRRLAESLSVPTAPGASCHTVRDAVQLASEMLHMHGGVILKRDGLRVSASHLRLCRKSVKNLAFEIGAWLESDPPDSTVVTVEALLTLSYEPTVELLVDDSGAVILSTGLMECRHGVFERMISPAQGLDPGHLALLTDCAGRVGRYLHGLGYRGTYDIDAGVTSHGDLVFFESNVRRTVTSCCLLR